MKRQPHCLELDSDKLWWRCTRCRRIFSDVDGEPKISIGCPGAPVYQWDPWPFGLYTEKQLSSMGYKPGHVAGLVPYSNSKDGDGYLRVYSLIDAQPKPALSERRAAALEKARAAAKESWKCKECGGHKSNQRRPYCESCEEKFKRESDREEAAEWARGMLERGCVILDTETTSLDGEIVQIAVIDHTGKVLLDTLCKPLDYPEPNEATEIHGITPEMVADAPSFGEVYEQLYPLLHGREIVIYNAAFDRGIIGNCRNLYHLPGFGWQATHCIMHWFAQWYGQWSNYFESYKWQPLNGDHTALGDCRSTLSMLQMMARNKEKAKARK